MEERSRTADELRAIAARLAAALAPGTRATTLALSGDLGAGKTTFSQGIARALGVTEIVSSPTFVIEKIYDLRAQRWERLIHIDAYRLNGADELRILRWDELVRDPANLVLIEWPERVESAIPEDATRIRFDIEGDGRIITINGGEESGKKSSEKGGHPRR